jgi:hypothetical protein
MTLSPSSPYHHHHENTHCKRLLVHKIIIIIHKIIIITIVQVLVLKWRQISHKFTTRFSQVILRPGQSHMTLERHGLHPTK